MILSQSYITQAAPDTSSAQVAGNVSAVNTLNSISYSTNLEKTSHSLIYEISNNSPNGYELHISLHFSDAIFNVSKDLSNDGFWGSDNVSFFQSLNNTSMQRFSTILNYVTTATYKARFKIDISSETPLSFNDLQDLIAINVIQY